MTLARVVDVDGAIGASSVIRYLEREPALDRRLCDNAIPVVVFEHDGYDDPSAEFFAAVQKRVVALVVEHGRALYVASCHVRPLFQAARPWPQIDAGPGALVGYFAVGEGGAMFFQPNGDRGADVALLEQAIGTLTR